MLVVQVEVPGQSRSLTCMTEIEGLNVGDRLLVDLDGRTSFASVVRIPLDLEWGKKKPSAKVLRRASRTDEDRQSHMEVQREEWLAIAREQVTAHELPMRILRADLTPSGKKVTLHFVADGRVDFRELVRDLARLLRTRVELRQIGVRDATVLQGGIGHCGQPLCCAQFLPGFSPVSMRMAKAQGLPLNPSKISGQCGRLMCCLRYELDEKDRKIPPRKGQGGSRNGSGGRAAGGRGRRGRRPSSGREKPEGACRNAKGGGCPRHPSREPDSGASGSSGKEER